ncbi:SKP1/BTB/POZ domain-containing protein [Artemisia annua]|uniref:SKP1/BTB/POZ domain-containing protein n=1 Tax=Artemisia annua TaxID=35608 RepID=A0A2U1L1X0_ARTAN|nr:SKP1/BTB/POZ domain-containing protein [Artemisia annua]
MGRDNMKIVEYQEPLLEKAFFRPVESSYHSIDSFVIRVVSSLGARKALTHLGIRDKQLKSSEDFIWALGCYFGLEMSMGLGPEPMDPRTETNIVFGSCSGSGSNGYTG